MIEAGKLDRRVQFRRYTEDDDGYQTTKDWVADGSPVWASRKDVSDAERAVAGWLEATIVSRFVVRSSSFTRSWSPKDRLSCGGVEYDITGIKEIGRRDGLEITATAVAV